MNGYHTARRARVIKENEFFKGNRDRNKKQIKYVK